MKAALWVAVIAVAGVALSGCSAMNPMTWWNDGPQEQPIQRLAGATRYQCADNKQLAIRYTGETQRQAMVILPEREFRLDPTAGATGGRYSNGRTTLNVQGDVVTLEENGTALYSGCKPAA